MCARRSGGDDAGEGSSSSSVADGHAPAAQVDQGDTKGNGAPGSTTVAYIWSTNGMVWGVWNNNVGPFFYTGVDDGGNQLHTYASGVLAGQSGATDSGNLAGSIFVG